MTSSVVFGTTRWALLPFARLTLCLSFTLTTGCGGESTPTPESAHDSAHETSTTKARAREGKVTTSEDESESAAHGACADGTCFACGAGSCPQGWYCDESAQGGPACSWLPECSKKPDCACIGRVLGSACSCAEEGGGPHAKCK